MPQAPDFSNQFFFTLEEGDMGVLWTPQHQKKNYRTPYHREKSGRNIVNAHDLKVYACYNTHLVLNNFQQQQKNTLQRSSLPMR